MIFNRQNFGPVSNISPSTTILMLSGLGKIFSISHIENFSQKREIICRKCQILISGDKITNLLFAVFICLLQLFLNYHHAHQTQRKTVYCKLL